MRLKVVDLIAVLILLLVLGGVVTLMVVFGWKDVLIGAGATALVLCGAVWFLGAR